MIYLCVLVWNLVLICGTSYLVFWKGISGWWFVLAMLLIAGVNIPRKESKK